MRERERERETDRQTDREREREREKRREERERDSVENLTMFFLQEANLNSCYIHFYYFMREFDIVASKEFEPLVS